MLDSDLPHPLCLSQYNVDVSFCPCCHVALSSAGECAAYGLALVVNRDWFCYYEKYAKCASAYGAVCAERVTPFLPGSAWEREIYCLKEAGCVMLVLSRKVGERIFVGDQVTITVVRITGGGVRLGIEAPAELPVVREELRSQGKKAKPRGDASGANEPADGDSKAEAGSARHPANR